MSGDELVATLNAGYAAVAHGVSLVSQNVDICCRFTRENLFRLEEVLTGLHPRHRTGCFPHNPRVA